MHKNKQMSILTTTEEIHILISPNFSLTHGRNRVLAGFIDHYWSENLSKSSGEKFQKSVSKISKNSDVFDSAIPHVGLSRTF